MQKFLKTLQHFSSWKTYINLPQHFDTKVHSQGITCQKCFKTGNLSFHLIVFCITEGGAWWRLRQWAPSILPLPFLAFCYAPPPPALLSESHLVTSRAHARIQSCAGLVQGRHMVRRSTRRYVLSDTQAGVPSRTADFISNPPCVVFRDHMQSFYFGRSVTSLRLKRSWYPSTRFRDCLQMQSLNWIWIWMEYVMNSSYISQNIKTCKT